MARLSRLDSQARTREKLLATAKAAFLRDGYATTSVEKVAERAGFSKGAVYSNFESKDHLCLAVIDAIRMERARALGAMIVKTTSLDARIAAFQRWSEENIGDRAWTALEVEFAVHASRDPALCRELAKRNEAIRTAITAYVGAYADEHDLVLPLPAEELALSFLSLGIGLGVQRAIDPSLPVRALPNLARILARSAKR